MPKDDYSAWPTKAAVAAELGISERSLERKVNAGELRLAHRAVPGRRAVAVLHPDDVASLRAQTLTAVPAPPPAAPESSALLKAAPAAGGQAAALVALVGQLARQAAPAAPALFLTLKQATEYSGLPAAYLGELIRDGKLDAINRGGYRIRRRDLDRL